MLGFVFTQYCKRNNIRLNTKLELMVLSQIQTLFDFYLKNLQNLPLCSFQNDLFRDVIFSTCVYFHRFHNQAFYLPEFVLKLLL